MRELMALVGVRTNVHTARYAGVDKQKAFIC